LNNPSIRGARDPGLVTFLWWLTTLGWAALIFYLSSGTFGGAFTAWLLQQVLNLLQVTVSAQTFASLHFLIRKLAHVTEYAMYGMLLYGSLGGGRDFTWKARRAVWCVAIAAAYSLTDELHQSLVPGREASLTDCGIDVAGATLAMLLLYAANRIFQAKANSTAARKETPAEK
jgi:VanZ family protein